MGCFNLFSSFQTFVSDFSTEVKKKRLVLSYSLILVDMQMLVDSLRGYLKFVFFRFIFTGGPSTVESCKFCFIHFSSRAVKHKEHLADNQEPPLPLFA